MRLQNLMKNLTKEEKIIFYTEDANHYYRYVKNSYQRNFFVGFSQTETVYNYGYIYINLAKLLDLFEQNDISYDISNSYNPYTQRDENITNFIFTYSKNKKLQKNKKDGIRND